MFCLPSNIQEQKKHAGLSEIDGKAKYTQLARSLPTYGIAFFLVKVVDDIRWYF